MSLFELEIPPPVDMHCHLSDAGGYRAAEPGALMLAVTNEPATWGTMHRNSRAPNVAWALGLHPCELRRGDERLSKLVEAMRDAVAIGEIGLDYSRRAHCGPAEQRSTLDHILSRPEAQDRLITLHSVGASNDIVAAVATHGTLGAILHWFLGSPSEVDAAVEANVYFSVNASMARSQRGRAALAEMPPNRVLAETDAPFTKVGKTTARPGQVDSVERSLARLWETDADDVRQRLWDNLGALQSRVNVTAFPDSSAGRFTAKR